MILGTAKGGQMANPKNSTSIYIKGDNQPTFEKIESFATRDKSVSDITFEAYKLWLDKQKEVAA